MTGAVVIQLVTSFRREPDRLACAGSDAALVCWIVNDPHVEMLSYDFVSLDERNDFSAAVPWSGDLGYFDCRLEKGQFKAIPQRHYSDAASARQELEPHLRGWELVADIESGLRISFRFSGARIVDRQPVPGSVTVAAQAAEAVGSVESATIRVGHSAYPTPPPRPLALSPLVQELRGLLQDLRTGHRMLVIANLILSSVEFEYGGKKRAESAIAVSGPVLRTLGRLAARNDPAERRKVDGPIVPLTLAEKHWIEAVLPKLVLQVAEATAGSQPPMLTMADLPPL